MLSTSMVVSPRLMLIRHWPCPVYPPGLAALYEQLGPPPKPTPNVPPSQVEQPVSGLGPEVGRPSGAGVSADPASAAMEVGAPSEPDVPAAEEDPRTRDTSLGPLYAAPPSASDGSGSARGEESDAAVVPLRLPSVDGFPMQAVPTRAKPIAIVRPSVLQVAFMPFFLRFTD